MGSNKTVIELNGKQYDALNGKLLEDKKATPHHSKSSAPKTLIRTNGRALDSFVHQPKVTAAPRSNPKPVSTKSKPAPRHAQSHLAHHQPQRTKTLMRAVVKKPAPTVRIEAVTTAVNPNSTGSSTAPGELAPVSQQRIARAKQIPKSDLVSRFGFIRPVIKKTGVVKVHQPPSAQPPAAPGLQLPEQPAHAGHASKDPWTQALSQATAHEAPHLKRPHLSKRIGKKLRVSSRLINAGAGTLAALVIIGFIGMQNLPNVEMRFASLSAGVHASMPSYQPSGFAIRGPVQATPGQVTISFRSNSDTRNFSVTQRASGWNSETLLDAFVAANQRQYQTFQNGGKTIYIYDGSNATWVDGGVWYRIEGNSSLTSDQLLRMADSM